MLKLIAPLVFDVHRINLVVRAHRCTLTRLCLGLRKTRRILLDPQWTNGAFSMAEVRGIILQQCGLAHGCVFARDSLPMSLHYLPFAYYHHDFFYKHGCVYQVVTSPASGEAETLHRLYLL